MNWMRLLLVMLVTVARVAGAGEAAQTVTAADLKGEPFVDAQTIATLTANTEVEVLGRQGGWVQVKPAAGSAGWLRMLSVKLSGGAASRGGSGLAELWNVGQTGRSGNTGITVASGVRGLGAEDLKNAKPDPDAVKKLGDFAVSKSDAEKFAGAAPLKSQSIDYMAASGTSEQSDASSGSGPFGGVMR